MSEEKGDWGSSANFISEVRPNPGNEFATCSICGAVLVCLSCGNHRDEATAHLAERVKELEQALERIADHPLNSNPCGCEMLCEWWCWLRHRGHVYNDGPTRPANECFWCGKRNPVLESNSKEGEKI
jgi:hypothetical protein